MNPTILVAEDNLELLEMIENFLLESGFFVLTAPTGSRALTHLSTSPVDLVLLDLDLGDMDGMEVLEHIRKRGAKNPPVIIVSSTMSIRRKTRGFATGCDDYIVKPFYLEELLARIRRMLERTGGKPETGRTGVLGSGRFTIDRQNRILCKDGEPIPGVRKRIFLLIEYFLANPDRTVTKQQIWHAVWDSMESPKENSLMVHISELRRLIEDDPDNPRYLVTEKGVGYRFNVRCS